MAESSSEKDRQDHDDGTVMKGNVVQVHDSVEDHRALLEALTEENRQLRLAADSFGRLAERLNEELRRMGGPRPRRDASASVARDRYLDDVE
jgi:hypothetical protein